MRSVNKVFSDMRRRMRPPGISAMAEYTLTAVSDPFAVLLELGDELDMVMWSDL